MKYQPQHDVIDPEIKSNPTSFDFETNADSDGPEDAYVIGEDGRTVRELGLQTSRRAKKGVDRWARPAAFGLMALFIVLTCWNLTRLLEGPPPPPRPTQFQSKQALYLGVMKIDAYRRVNGVTPETLSQVGLPAEGAYDYRRVSPTRYVLSFQGNGSKIEYDSTESKELFFGSPQDMLTIGGSQ